MAARKFRGRTTHTLDSKGRLNIPARMRAVLAEYYETDELIVVPWFDHVRVYPPDVWDICEDKLVNEGPEHDLGDFTTMLLTGVEETRVDRQGRILLRPKVRKDGGIESSEVVLAGVKDYFMIEDNESYEMKREQIKANLAEEKKKLQKLNLF